MIQHPSWSTSPIASWLVEHGGRRCSAEALVDELCRRLVAAGVPLFRVSVGFRSMHPQLFAHNIRWVRGAGATEIRRPHGIEDTAHYRNSPVALIHQGQPAFRRRLDQDPDASRYPVLQELRAEGGTDFLALGLPFSTGQINYVSWCTDAAGGFTDEQLAILTDLMPLIAQRLELEAAHSASETLLATYIGGDAASRVLDGTIRRGQGATIRAAIWFCDLRDFTAMVDARPQAEIIATLDDYFECMARPILDEGGEVLKFIGDAMLAIFSIDDLGLAQCCPAALRAAVKGQEGLSLLNDQRRADGLAALEVDIALHLGEVMYGNIGAADRLDFTVIGPAVNEVTRVEGLCRSLGRKLLASAAFAHECSCAGMELVSLGRHHLRGVAEPKEIFAPAECLFPD